MTKEQIVNDQDKVWVNVERTINLGNYENIKLSVGESRTVTQDDDPEELRRKVMNQALKEIDELTNNYQ